MTRLAELRSQLQTVALRRRTARWVVGGSALVLTALWALAIFFVIDWTFSMGRFERAFTLLIAAGAMTTVYWTLARPWFNRRENEMDVALLVEKQRGIDSDLVAALQFEEPAARSWGSQELREAVIEYVTDYGKEWNLLADFPRDQMKRRAVLVGVSALAIGLAMAVWPGYAGVLMNRVLLGSRHYPTSTKICEVAIGDERFALTPYGQHDILAKRPFGTPLDFAVRCEAPAGKVSAQGTLRFQAANGLKSAVSLTPDEKQPGTYRGQLPRLVDPISFSIEVGDAWTDPAAIDVVPLPVVEMKMTATPPAYAARLGQSTRVEQTSRRQLSVFEGSRVDLDVVCPNKTLTFAVLTLGDAKFPLTRTDAEGHAWRLSADKTPLAAVSVPLHFSLDVRDQDNLAPEHPIEGTIAMEADRPPQVEMRLATRQCWPGAGPKIDFAVSDDFALSSIVLHVQVRRAGGKSTQDVNQTVWEGQGTANLGNRRELKNRFVLDLVPLKLNPGDQVAVQMEARDYRGERKGEATLSSPESLSITDRITAERAITNESDARGEQLFGDIISRLTGAEGKR
ncbi:MAG: hypothetical protein K8T25_23590 [Planctomycetia bacterium]|nr:hypothetical protein [Planctomycetia bacterium]